jgi:hypothetical protein
MKSATRFTLIVIGLARHEAPRAKIGPVGQVESGSAGGGGVIVASEVGWLWFWVMTAKKKASPTVIRQALIDGRTPDGLQGLAVDEILAALKEHFPSVKLNKKKRLGEFDLPDEQTAFELSWSDKHVAFTFYGDAWKQMDAVVDLMTKSGLACYDYGGQKMYSVQKPPRFTGTADEEEIKAEWDKVMMEESNKIEASTSNRLEQLKQKHAFMKSGGMERAREEAVRRVKARKG